LSRVVKFNVRDFIICLLVGIAIAAILLTFAITNPPWLQHLPDKWVSFLLGTALLFGFAVSQYRRGWTCLGYWGLLAAWLVLHAGVWIWILRSTGYYPPFPASVIIVALEGMALMASIYWLLGIPPPLRQK
jgi:hypothetical protein